MKVRMMSSNPTPRVPGMYASLAQTWQIHEKRGGVTGTVNNAVCNCDRKSRHAGKPAWYDTSSLPSQKLTSEERMGKAATMCQ